MISVGIAAPDSKRTSTISIEVATLDRLVIAIRHSIIAFTESFTRNRITRGTQLVATMGKGALITKVTGTGGLE